MGKVAVCLSGGIRTLEYCFSTMRRLLEDQGHTYDIFAALVSDDVEAATRALHFLSPHDYKVIAPHSFSKYFENVIDSRGRHFGFSVAYPMAFSNYVSNHLRQESGKSYDFVIRARPDLYYAAFTLRKTDDGTVNVPSISSYGNVCDQFAYGSEAAMDKYFGWWNWLDALDPVALKMKYYGKRRMGICEQKDMFYLSPEFLLREYLSSQHLRVFRRAVDFRIMRPCHVGVPYTKIPINNQRYKGTEI